MKTYPLMHCCSSGASCTWRLQRQPARAQHCRGALDNDDEIVTTVPVVTGTLLAPPRNRDLRSCLSAGDLPAGRLFAASRLDRSDVWCRPG